ncbi:hypothetical protein [Bifidobacterium tissieri]|uniref:Uncharacterized protein n=1 Tax=Bifidobacterium tissieri TaxID=1630162 RepID=A0A5M9ZRD4_9BIFI|nr:hypothetical protein [Bifidobacterium tissieri]KAA8830216.1 hypothetical protein EMO89_06045 [Bifidobacterium tissieri]KAA8833064.1 hypothetical protein EM849_02265 [Bifidobacterium tissieri]
MAENGLRWLYAYSLPRGLARNAELCLFLILCRGFPWIMPPDLLYKRFVAARFVLIDMLIVAGNAK